MMDFGTHRFRGYRRSIVRAVGHAVIAAWMVTITSSAARAQPAPLPDKPFAEHRIVLQLSDNDPRKEGLVVSVANNLLKLYGPDKAAIEVVARSEERRVGKECRS